MTCEEALESIHTGIALARESVDTGVFATGDMGIGNTTSATAIILACIRKRIIS